MRKRQINVVAIGLTEVIRPCCWWLLQLNSLYRPIITRVRQSSKNVCLAATRVGSEYDSAVGKPTGSQKYHQYYKMYPFPQIIHFFKAHLTLDVTRKVEIVVVLC
jgi:hypothetical protein